jgi:hypothetical protein
MVGLRHHDKNAPTSVKHCSFATSCIARPGRMRFPPIPVAIEGVHSLSRG